MSRSPRTFFSAVLGMLLAGSQSPGAQMINLQTNASSAFPAGPAALASGSGQLAELIRQVDAAEAAYVKADGTDRDRLWQAYVSLNTTNVPKVVELAAQDVRSPIAFRSFEWVVTNRQVQAGSRRLLPFALRAVELLHEHGYSTNPAVGPLCWGVGHNWDCLHQPTLGFLQEVMGRNSDRDARGTATFALARLMKQKSELLGWLENAPGYMSAEWRNAATEEAKKVDSQTVLREAERLFENVLVSYADCPVKRKSNSTLGEMAAPELYEIRHLWIGKVAPEIEGEDLDGNQMKLSDYRGRVVVLNFWGSWCGPCMAMVPYERKLAERMTGKPFALVGVNSDVDRLHARRAVENEKITWRSFWCGTNGSDGAIPSAWNVKGWPTAYILDPKGTIRLKLEGFGGTNTDSVLNETVDRLLKEPAAVRKEQ